MQSRRKVFWVKEQDAGLHLNWPQAPGAPEQNAAVEINDLGKADCFLSDFLSSEWGIWEQTSLWDLLRDQEKEQWKGRQCFL